MKGRGRARAASHRQPPRHSLKTVQRTIIGRYAWRQRGAPLCLGAHASAQHTGVSHVPGWRSTAQRGVVEAQASACAQDRGAVRLCARDRKRDGQFFVPRQVRAYQERPRPPHGTGIYLVWSGAAPLMLKRLGSSGGTAALCEGKGRARAASHEWRNGPLSAGVRVASEGGAPLPRDSCLRAAHWSQPCPRLAQHRP